MAGDFGHAFATKGWWRGSGRETGKLAFAAFAIHLAPRASSNALELHGLVLFLLFQFEDYPLEKFMLGISAFNPIDLSRILILLQMDISALMGYTGAVFKDFFGTQAGMLSAVFVLLLWIAVPTWLSLRKFNVKDL